MTLLVATDLCLSLSIGDVDIHWIDYFPTVITGTGLGLLFSVFDLELKVTGNINVIFHSMISNIYLWCRQGFRSH